MVNILHTPVATKTWKQVVIEHLAGWGGAHVPLVADGFKFLYERFMLGGSMGGVQVANIAALQALTVADIDALLTRTDTSLVVVTVLDDGSGSPRSFLWVTASTETANAPYVVAPTAGNGRWFGLPSVDDAPSSGMFDAMYDEVLAAAADNLGNIAVATKFAGKHSVLFEASQRGRVRVILAVNGGQQAAETLTIRIKVNNVAVWVIAGLTPGDGDTLGVECSLFVRAGGAAGVISGIGTVAGESSATISGAVDLTEARDVEVELEWSAQDAAHDVDLLELVVETFGG